MYAVIATGGKQYRVTKDATLRVEKLDAEPGATVVRHGKGEKVSIVKFRRRKHYLRRKNHRQSFTEVKVTEISAG